MWLIAQRLAAAPLRYFLNDGGFFLYVSKVAWLSLGKYLQGIAFGRWWWWGDRRHCAINRISKGCINNKSQQRIILVSTCFETSLEAKSAKTRRISLLQEKRGGDENNSRAYFLAFFAGLWVSLECQAGWLEGVLSWKKTIPAFNAFKATVLQILRINYSGCDRWLTLGKNKTKHFENM